MKKLRLVFLAMLGFIAQPAVADWIGLQPGRSANLDNAANMSVDAGINLNGDLRFLGARFNFKASPDLLAFGDIGTYDRGDSFDGDGLALGGGIIYQLRNVQLLENTDTAVRAVYHTASIDCGGSCEFDVSEFGAMLIVSGDQLSTTDFGWYANAGFHNVSLDIGGFFGNISSTEIAIGGGITGNLAFGEWFAGVELIDELLFGVGIRYNLN